MITRNILMASITVGLMLTIAITKSFVTLNQVEIETDTLSQSNTAISKSIMTTTTTTNNNKSNDINTSSTKAINYYLQTEPFLNTLISCMKNQECNIYFQHVPKTGGTTIEKRFYPKLYEKSCCTQKIMKDFYKKPYHYCNKKFMSLQVSGRDFVKVVDKCKNIKSRIDKPIVVLTATREPISRTLSGIHQICNENLWTRSDSVQRACRICNYEHDTEYWMTFTDRANKLYRDQYWSLQTLATVENVNVLYIDTQDLSDLFNRLLERMPKWEGDVILGQSTTFNPESRDTCSFGLKSEMIKALRPCLDIYRNLTLGII